MATEKGEFTLRGRAEVVGGTSSVLLKEKADAVLSPRREDGEHDAHPHNCPDEPMVGSDRSRIHDADPQRPRPALRD
ncbi:MAG: hypothetical protein ACTHV5_10725, partial [Candidatus Corynebacterium faecigallinarum]